MRRRGVTVLHVVSAATDPQVSVPEITVDLRVFWPPAATQKQVEQALAAGYWQAFREVDKKMPGGTA